MDIAVTQGHDARRMLADIPVGAGVFKGGFICYNIK